MKKILVSLTVATLFVTSTFGQAIKSAWVTTDRTVDCSSYESIAKDVIKSDMTEEEKALAMYDFFRMQVFHFRNTPESRDPIKNINVLGFTLCGSQGTCMKGLLESIGIKARVVAVPGHTIYEAFYDGKWHGFDTFMNFYVFTRGEGDQRNVASYEELQADPTLVSDAIKEGRTCPNWCPCGDKPMMFTKGYKVLGYKPRKLDWSVKDYELRDGEELVRTWKNLGIHVPGSFAKKYPCPMHSCGSRDEKNPPELFKFWEPYGIPGLGGKSVVYRYQCNGFSNFSPDLSKPEYADALKSGELTIPVHIPYYIAGGKLTFVADLKGEDSIDVLVSKNGTFTKVFTATSGDSNEYSAILDSVIVLTKAVGLHKYQLKFKLNGNAKLKNFYLKTIFVHNAMSAPQLMPGKNNVKVEVANADALKKTPLTLIYRYKDAPGWSKKQVIEKTITKSPFIFKAKLPDTDRLPQMTDITLRCGTLAWEPESLVLPDKIVFDFSEEAARKQWSEAGPIKISSDKDGIIFSSDTKTGYHQVSTGTLTEDWTGYANLVIEYDNMGPKPQFTVFRIKSDGQSKKADIQQTLALGETTVRVPLTGVKANLAKITKLYLMPLNASEEGCKIKIKRVFLEPKQAL
ncbi:MAG: hypothetical protein KAI74_02325 [Kiritimatiellae bacterium]|nr:hypothetical protein [Kiritimatiellia bacterium]